ncbi:MAG: DUF302 domain-containing protein [Solirubrobacteraceae bacterium]
MSGYEHVGVTASPPAVLAALREVLAERGLIAYVVVDHGHDMAAAGAPRFVAWTVIFGNPAAGAKLLARDPAAAVDIPLRLAVVQATEGTEIVLRDMRTLLDAGLTEIADAFTGVLRSIAAQARVRATG